MKSLLLSSSLVFAASLLSYWSSLDGGFVFDDHRAILTNEDLDASKTTLWEVFQHDFWGGLMSRRESHKSYRPLTVLTYRYLNFHLTGLQPYSYHLVNMLLHGVASVLVLCCCRCILGSGGLQVSVAGLQIGAEWSTYAGLMFAVHSIHTEAVASVVGRAEVLSCIFLLLSFLCYRKSMSRGSGPAPSSLPHTSWPHLLGSVFLSACSMLSKEQGIVALGVCASYDIIVHWEVFWNGLFCWVRDRKVAMRESVGSEGTSGGEVLLKGSLGGVITEERNGTHSCTNGGLNSLVRNTSGQNSKQDKKKTPSDSSFRNLAKRLGVLVGSGLLLMWFRLSMNYNTQPIFKEEELRAIFHPDRSVRILSFSNIYALNAWLLLSPSSLCCDWTLGSIPLVTSLSDPRNIWSLLLYLSLAILLARVCMGPTRERVAPGMGVALLLLTFLPASGLVFRVGFVIAERVLYMPSVGLCLLVAAGARRLSHMFQHKVMKILQLLLLTALLVVMAAKTHTRNKDWTSDFALFESGVRVNPNNVKLRNNYGIELKSVGRDREAMHQYQRSLAIDPKFGEVYMNIGNLLSDDRKFAEAVVYYEKAIELPQMYHKTLNNLATTYFRLGRLEEAEVRFKESIQANPDQPMTFNNLASLYGEMKRYKESEAMFRKALKLNPQYTEAYFNLGTLFVQMNELEKGEKYLRKALELQPNHLGAQNNLKVVEYYRRTKSQ